MTFNILLSPARRFAKLLGIDMNVFFVILTRGWSAFAGIITILLVGQFLTQTEQGYLYVFNNLLGMKIFFELGLSNIILTFASHEKAHLELKDGKITGDEVYVSRLSSLAQKSFKMYSIIGALIFLFLMIGGFVFFIDVETNGETILWQIPWVIMVVVSALRILALPMIAIISGCGFMKSISRNSMIEIIATNLTFWIFLSLGFQLLALSFGAIMGLIFMVGLIYREFLPYIKTLMKKKTNDELSLSWKKEILPLQSQSGMAAVLSWVIIQFSAPLLMKVQDPIVAGQMGMTLSVMAIISQLGFFWVRARAPEMASLIAKKEFKKADGLFLSILVRVSLIILLGFGLVVLSRYALDFVSHPFIVNYRERVLSTESFVFLSVVYIMMHLWNSSEIYLRCYKKEPYFIGAIILGIMVATVQYFSAKNFTIEVFCLYYALTVSIVVLSVGSYMFFVRRKVWQKKMQDG